MYRSVVLLLFPIKAQVTVNTTRLLVFMSCVGVFSVALRVLASRLLLFLPLPNFLSDTQRQNDLLLDHLESRIVETLNTEADLHRRRRCLLVFLRVVCPPQLSPLSLLPSPSTSNKAPEPAPRRPNIVNRKLSQTTSPTVQPPLSPLAAWAARVLWPTTDGEQPYQTGAGGGGGGVVGGSGGDDGGLSGAAQVATMNPLIVTQLSAEESR